MPAYVVVDPPRSPIALLARSPHLGERVIYCRSSGWFEDAAHGTKFDRLGNYELGPGTARPRSTGDPRAGRRHVGEPERGHAPAAARVTRHQANRSLLFHVRPDELERRLRQRLDAVGPAPRAELLHVLQPYVKHGIYGYACRAKRNSNEWSTHAFGIAVDVSSAEEYLGKCTSTVNRNHASIWQNHGWYWGLAFCDPMHFQYATNY